MSSDTPRRARAARAAVSAAALLMLCGRAVFAQSSVHGQIALVERQGAEHSDLRSAVVYLELPGRPIQVAKPELRQASIAMTGREFVPRIRAVSAGGTVTFPNQDPFSHNVFSNADAGPFDLGLYRRGSSRVATFARPGIYPIYCNIHSRMVSFVIAVPSPHLAFVGADGRFTIPDVSPGTYLVHAWHERAGARVTRELVVTASGAPSLRLVLDARAYVPGPHLNKFGLPYSATRVDKY